MQGRGPAGGLFVGEEEGVREESTQGSTLLFLLKCCLNGLEDPWEGGQTPSSSKSAPSPFLPQKG